MMTFVLLVALCWLRWAGYAVPELLRYFAFSLSHAGYGVRQCKKSAVLDDLFQRLA
jgi:hypothetical protein